MKVCKQEFLTRLRKDLSGLPQNDVEERLIFYSEMIDDRIEEGLSEEEAVLAVGSTEEIVAQIIAETPLAKIAKERIKSKKSLSAVEIVLLTLGSPVWLSLGIAAFAVILSLYVSMWAVIVSLWSVFGSLALCSVCSVPAFFIFIINGNGASGVALLAAGIACAGLSIFAFYGCKASTIGVLKLTRNLAIWIKNCFIKKEVAK